MREYESLLFGVGACSCFTRIYTLLIFAENAGVGLPWRGVRRTIPLRFHLLAVRGYFVYKCLFLVSFSANVAVPLVRQDFPGAGRRQLGQEGTSVEGRLLQAPSGLEESRRCDGSISKDGNGQMSKCQQVFSVYVYCESRAEVMCTCMPRSTRMRPRCCGRNHYPRRRTLHCSTAESRTQKPPTLLSLVPNLKAAGSLAAIGTRFRRAAVCCVFRCCFISVTMSVVSS